VPVQARERHVQRDACGLDPLSLDGQVGQLGA
jgi:hypothetical protein